MTDLERARAIMPLIRKVCAFGPMEWGYTGEQAIAMLAQEFAAARREGFADGRRAKRETLRRSWEAGAEEMRERAADRAPRWGDPELRDLILALPLTPEEPK